MSIRIMSVGYVQMVRANGYVHWSHVHGYFFPEILYIVELTCHFHAN